MLAFAICFFKISYSEKRGRRFEWMVEVDRELLSQAAEAVRKAGGPFPSRRSAGGQKPLGSSSEPASILVPRWAAHSLQAAWVHECREDDEKWLAQRKRAMRWRVEDPHSGGGQKQAVSPQRDTPALGARPPWAKSQSRVPRTPSMDSKLTAGLKAHHPWTQSSLSSAVKCKWH